MLSTMLTECLFYLAGLREQSVFNFAAIPQSMAIATLALCFRNPKLFERNVKITKGEACQLMLESTQNLQVVCDVFKKYTKVIRRKNVPSDPNFLKISIACGKIEQFIESIFPSANVEEIVAQGELQKTVGLGAVQKKKTDAQSDEAWYDTFYLFLMVAGLMFVVFGSMLFVAWLAGARFDLLISDLKPSNWGKLREHFEGNRSAVTSAVHKEL